MHVLYGGREGGGDEGDGERRRRGEENGEVGMMKKKEDKVLSAVKAGSGFWRIWTSVCTPLRAPLRLSNYLTDYIL